MLFVSRWRKFVKVWMGVSVGKWVISFMEFLSKIGYCLEFLVIV